MGRQERVALECWERGTDPVAVIASITDLSNRNYEHLVLVEKMYLSRGPLHYEYVTRLSQRPDVTRFIVVDFDRNRQVWRHTTWRSMGQ